MLARLPIQLEFLETRRLLSASISNRLLTVIGGAGNDGISLSRTGVDDVIATVNGVTWQFDMDNFDSAVLNGVGGNDRIANASGIENVSLDGGSGNDRLIDGNGSNTLIGVGGDDTLSPGTGDDFLTGGSGTDTVDYSPHSAGLHFSLTSYGNDGPTVRRTGETDRLATFENADEDSILDTEHFIGTAFRDTFHYQASEQDIVGDFPVISVEGRGGNDGFSTAGRRGSFVAIGGSGDDTFGINAGLAGFGQDTTLIGGDGNDVFHFDDDTGPDVIDGGGGTDSITLVHVGTPRVIDLNNFTSVENASMGAEDALLIGTPGPNRLEIANDGTIQGGDGNDTLLGGNDGDQTLLGQGGDDVLDGGRGADQLFGGDGRDTADYSARNDNLTIIHKDALANDGETGEGDLVSEDIERVLGGSGDDRYVGNERPNVFFGGDGNDTMTGNGAADALHGENGNDLLVGVFGNDFLDGGAGDDEMYGQNGNDTLLGQSGNDRLFADDGVRDSVNGGSGTDSADVDGADAVTGVETVT
jgi:Ca2+-binding RTX toxin-like protein